MKQGGTCWTETRSLMKATLLKGVEVPGRGASCYSSLLRATMNSPSPPCRLP